MVSLGGPIEAIGLRRYIPNGLNIPQALQNLRVLAFNSW